MFLYIAYYYILHRPTNILKHGNAKCILGYLTVPSHHSAIESCAACPTYLYVYLFIYLFIYLRAVGVLLYIARENLVKNYIFTSLARKCSRCVLDESILRG